MAEGFFNDASFSLLNISNGSRTDLFTMAGDAMRGREGGTIDELNASVWVAERARQIGLQPAGDNGTYFQFFPLERMRVSPLTT